MERTILLHLDQYFNDDRKLSELYINDRFKNINDLQEYIKHVFNINSSFCLLNMSGIQHSLIPRSEDIRILSGMSHIMVKKVTTADFIINPVVQEITCNENCNVNAANISVRSEKRSSTNSLKRLSNESTRQNGAQMEHIVTRTPEKIIILSDVIINPTEAIVNHETLNQTNDQMQHEYTQETLENGVENENYLNTTNPADFTTNGIEKSHLTPILETSEIRYSNDVAMDSSVCEDDNSLAQADNITTRGRKRIRKRKRLSNTTTPVTPIISLPKEVSLLRKAVDSLNARSSRASHIRFDENNDTLDATINASLESTLNNTSLNKTNLNNSNINNSSFNNGNSETSPLSTILENKRRMTDIAKKAKIVQGFCKENTIVNQQLEDTTDNAWESLCKNFNPSEFPNLTNLPEQDDIIGFRMLKMSNSYEPQLSKYIFGMVLEIEKNQPIGDSNLTIQILAGFENCAEPTGKFALPDDDSNETNYENSNLTLKWMNVLEPKKIV